MALKWLQNGAQPTPTAKDLLSKAGITAAFEELRRGETKEN